MRRYFESREEILVRLATTAWTEWSEDVLRRLDQAGALSTAALAAAFWQYSHPGEALSRLYATDPRLSHAAVDFLPRVTLVVTALSTGLMAETAGGDAATGTVARSRSRD
ncbi:hypothetical protein ACFV6Z_02200 [Streptomyces sp. NPDC059818]|uniref:hypothetical protein n=1 Tax=Streptomyces sp. NPDC059818 TaxID=3346962 RepID=UPI00364F5332